MATTVEQALAELHELRKLTSSLRERVERLEEDRRAREEDEREANRILDAAPGAAWERGEA